MEIIYANEENFKNEIENGLVLVDFYAEWCGPCKMLEPILETIAQKDQTLQIVKVDVDQYPDIAGDYGVMSMPTMILFKDGKILDQTIGVKSQEDLETWINSKK